MIRFSIITIAFIVSSINAKSQVVSIANARAQTVGNTVTVRGIVTNGSELGVIRYMQDATAGIAVYSGSFNPVRGDSVEVIGVLDDYNGLLEINPLNSFTIISSGHTVIPEVVSITQLNTGDNYEGELIQINAITFVQTGTFSNSSTNYDATDGSSTAEVRIDAANNIGGTPIPASQIDLVGVLGEFSGVNQLLPRDLNDLISAGNPPIINSALWQTNISQNSFTVNFTSQNDGNTIIEYGLTQSLGLKVQNATMTTNHSMTLNLLTPTTLYYVQGKTVSATGDTSVSAIVPMMTQSNSTGTISVFFNRPVDHSKSTGTPAIYLNNTIADTLIKYMDITQNTLEIAIYNLDNDNGLIDAINDTYSRGVNVRVICNEGVNSNAYNAINVGNGNKKLSPTGTAPNGDFYGIMHNKVMIVDANSTDPNAVWVFAGSTNWTDGQLNDDPNNMLMIQDQSLAIAYKMEFEEMWGNTFGPMKTDNTPHYFKIGEVPVELYFSPSDDPETKIINTIQSADNDLHYAMLTHTRTSISYEIADRVNAGVFAAGIVEDTSSGGGPAYDILNAVIPNSLFISNTPGIFHHKYVIVDANCPMSDPTVETGSHNWTSSARLRNDENMLIIHDESIVNQYYQEFSQRYIDESGTEYSTPCPVGMDELVEQEMISIYPNPAVEWAIINAQWANQENTVLKVFDLLGTEVFTATFADYHLLNTAQWTAGTYLISCINGEKQSVAKLIIMK